MLQKFRFWSNQNCVIELDGQVQQWVYPWRDELEVRLSCNLPVNNSANVYRLLTRNIKVEQMIVIGLKQHWKYGIAIGREWLKACTRFSDSIQSC